MLNCIVQQSQPDMLERLWQLLLRAEAPGFWSGGQTDRAPLGPACRNHMELQPCRPPAGTDTESGASQAGRQAKEETNQERPFKSSPTPTPVHRGSSGAGSEPLPVLPEHQPSAGLQQPSTNYLLKLM